MDLCMGTLEELVGGKIAGCVLKSHSYLSIIRHIIRGVSYLHQLGVVHRNLKPSNVFVFHSKDALKPVMKLSDFGLRKVQDAGMTHQITEGWMCPFDSRDPMLPSFDIFPLDC